MRLIEQTLERSTSLYGKDFDNQVARTEIGMAHFAGSGPAGETCRTYIHWLAESNRSKYYGKSGLYANSLKPAPCAKFASLQRVSPAAKAPKVQYVRAACKYHEKNETPLPITRSDS